MFKIIAYFFSICFSAHSIAAQFGIGDLNFPTKNQLESLLERADRYEFQGDMNSEIMVNNLAKISTISQKNTDLLQAFNGGEQLLKTAIKLEEYCHENSCSVWWRFSDDLQNDIAKNKPKSFSLCLLGGYLNDGRNYFTDGYLAFDTACTYIYWRNAHYFRYELVKEQQKFINEFDDFITRFSELDITEYSNMKLPIMSLNSTGLADSPRDFPKWCEKIRLSMSAIITNIQYTNNYKSDPTKYRASLEQLNNKKQRLFSFDKTRIETSMRGTLYAFPVPKILERSLLQQKVNKEVEKLSKQLDCSGEKFHPRLSSDDLEKYKDKFVPVYQNGVFADETHVMKSLERAIQSTYEL